MKHGIYNPLAGNILLVKKEATIYTAFMDVSTSIFVLILWKLATEAHVLIKASGCPERANLVCPAGTLVPMALPGLGVCKAAKSCRSWTDVRSSKRCNKRTWHIAAVRSNWFSFADCECGGSCALFMNKVLQHWSFRSSWASLEQPHTEQ